MARSKKNWAWSQAGIQSSLVDFNGVSSGPAPVRGNGTPARKRLKENRSEVFILSRLREERTYRDAARARQLLKEFEGLLGGKVPMPPKPPRPARPEDQLELLKTLETKNRKDNE
jgi:hypothetical protein